MCGNLTFHRPIISESRIRTIEKSQLFAKSLCIVCCPLPTTWSFERCWQGFLEPYGACGDDWYLTWLVIWNVCYFTYSLPHIICRRSHCAWFCCCYMISSCAFVWFVYSYLVSYERGRLLLYLLKCPVTSSKEPLCWSKSKRLHKYDLCRCDVPK